MRTLRDLRERLARVEPWPWHAVATWVAAARPFFRAEAKEHLEDFEKEVAEPTWAMYVRVRSEDVYGRIHDTSEEADADEERDNRRLGGEAKARVLAFMDGVIEVAERSQSTTPTPSFPSAVQQIVDRFEHVCRALARRSRDRTPLLMEDEYDVQYLFGALLRMSFDDVRPEEPTPSLGGAGARMDFLVKAERLAIELKMVRAGLPDREVTDELLLDIARYANHPDCDTLVCFVYDPTFKLKNPRAIENDLPERSRELNVHVFVRPM